MSPFAGVVVGRNEDGKMDEAEGMKEEIRFGNGLRVLTGTERGSLIVGKVVSPAMEGVLYSWVSEK